MRRLASLIWLALLGCSGGGLESAWQPADAPPPTWEGVPFESSGGLEVGAVNGAEHLELCFYPADRPVAFVLLRQGVTAWLTSAQGATIGLRIRPARAAADSLEMLEPPDSSAASTREERDPLRARAKRTPLDIETLAADGTPRDTTRAGTGGALDARVEIAEAPYYVMRIPLAMIGAEPGDRVKLRVETPEFVMPARVAERLARRRATGRAGGGFGQRTGERGARPDIEAPDPVDLRVRLTLADGP
jgi:hypothetical protein